jgi:hypothetical protein
MASSVLGTRSHIHPIPQREKWCFVVIEPNRNDSSRGEATREKKEAKTHIPIIVPVATPHRNDSLTHHRNGDSSIVLRMPKASGNILVHGSVMIALSSSLVASCWV